MGESPDRCARKGWQCGRHHQPILGGLPVSAAESNAERTGQRTWSCESHEERVGGSRPCAQPVEARHLRKEAHMRDLHEFRDKQQQTM